MIGNINIRGGNFLTDAEAVAFTGAANAAAIVTAFNAKPNPNTVSKTFPEYGATRWWPVHALATVYGIDHNEVQGKLNDLIAAGSISGVVVTYAQ
ncbi:MAG: hypothetical protein PHF31_05795 [Methylobacter sp.]|nr:hypothetical protein [Methylobacter sp.]